MLDPKAESFESLSRVAVETSFVAEVRAFLRANRKWWLVPIFVCLLTMGALLALSTSAVAPFIYTLF